MTGPVAAASPGPKRVWRDVDGILLLDKPLVLSSNAALQRVRRLFRARKAGHTGSLDPLATGLLPICFGQATKVSGLLLEADKSYLAEGEEIAHAPVPALDAAAIERAFAALRGQILQLPPMYSALKHEGQRLYTLARQGLEVEREPRAVTVHELELLPSTPETLEFRVRCSKGTYIRTLAEDLARALGTVGHLLALRRIRLGPFDGLPMYTLAGLESLAAAGGEAALDALLLGPDRALVAYPAVAVDVAGERGIRQGQRVAAVGPSGRLVRIYGPDQRFLGLGETSADGARLAPVRLFSGPD
jgi:tRNA pseudouridine55 synthase